MARIHTPFGHFSLEYCRPAGPVQTGLNRFDLTIKTSDHMHYFVKYILFWFNLKRLWSFLIKLNQIRHNYNDLNWSIIMELSSYAWIGFIGSITPQKCSVCYMIEFSHTSNGHIEIALLKLDKNYEWGKSNCTNRT